MSRLKKGGTLAALACATLIASEGIRLKAYPDPATKGHPWTVCMGETKGVKRGDVHTLDECRAMLIARVDEFGNGVEVCTPSAATMPPKRYVAHVSLAYNIGVGAYCKSSVSRLENAGMTRASCDAFLKWNRAAGMVFPGLTRRRQEERAMCLEGLNG